MFAKIVLYSWPLFVKIVFDNKSLPFAVLFGVIGGYLLLPEQTTFDLPLFPDLNKHTIPILAVLVFALLAKDQNNSQKLKGLLPKNGYPIVFLLILVFGAVMTVLTNSDPQIFGPLFLPGLTIVDSVSRVSATVLLVLPLIVGRKYLAHPDQHRTFLVVLAIAGALYSLPSLYEIRMSPQLSNMVYGFFPHSWLQHVRDGGFRPVVFLNHGLWLSIFFAYASVAAIGYSKIAPEGKGLIYLGIGLWIFATVALSKSLGALVLSVVFLSLCYFASTRLQLLICAAIAAIVLLYPALRGADLVPVDRAVTLAERVSENRAASLQFRLDNENPLLERAQERPLFGWGMWGRSLVFDEDGVETSVPDGYWVIIVGVGGWARYLGEFGLLCMPIILTLATQRKNEIGPETTVLVLALTLSIVDLIPNGTISPITWLMAGALWGRLELGKVTAGETPPGDTAGRSSQQLRYTRFGTGERHPTSKTQRAVRKNAATEKRVQPKYSRFGRKD